MNLDDLEARAEMYSRNYPPGTACRYWQGVRTGRGALSTIRSRFWVMGTGEIVCEVAGVVGGVTLRMLQFTNLYSDPVKV